MTLKKQSKRIDPLALRQRLGLNQPAFWNPIGMTQSGGSRYESGGRRISPPVSMLIDLVYVKGLIPEQFEAGDMAILLYLKAKRADLYATLAKAADGDDTSAKISCSPSASADQVYD